MTDEINNPVVVTYDAENDWVFAVVRGRSICSVRLARSRSSAAR